MRKWLLEILCFFTGATFLCFFTYIINMAHQPMELRHVIPSFLLGGILGLLFYRWHLRNRTYQENIHHTNRVLKSLRSANRMVTQTEDRAQLIRNICEVLVENRGYYSVWIALTNAAGQWDTFAEAGLDNNFHIIRDEMKRGKLPACCKKAMSRADIVIADNPATLCIDCPIASSNGNCGTISIRLEYQASIYGLLTLSVPRELIVSTDEKELVEELAADIAFGLHTLKLEKEREKAQKALEQSMQKLDERVKELNCLFELSKLVEKPGQTLPDILQGAVNLIPPATQHPQQACAKIVIEGTGYQTENFMETPGKFATGIAVRGESTGTLTVCYLDSQSSSGSEPFLEEEKKMFRAIGERLGKTVERREAQAALQASERRFRTLVENTLTGISIVQNGEVVYQNNEQERLLGPLPRASVFSHPELIHPGDIAKVEDFNRQIQSGMTRPEDVEFRYAPDGKLDNPKWIHCRTSPIIFRGQDSLIVNMMDISQTRKLENLLVVQDKLASLGRVAAGIAHEIRNPLSGINIYLNMLEKFYYRDESGEKVAGIFTHMKSASVKIESVIKRVMDFSKPGQPDFMETDINPSIEEAISLTSVSLRKSGVKIEKSLTPDLPKCRLDPQQIEEVVLNLINNAADAMKNADYEKKIKVTSDIDNDRIIIRVFDSSPGIPVDIGDRVFDPFVRSIVRQSPKISSKASFLAMKRDLSAEPGIREKKG